MDRFDLAITAIGLGVDYGSCLFGLSFAFGAFAAGVVLSESDYSHQARKTSLSRGTGDLLELN
jgi:predicted Kef-type K+ transport protein